MRSSLRRENLQLAGRDLLDHDLLDKDAAWGLKACTYTSWLRSGPRPSGL
jgi:hypothetical protein